MKSSIEKLSNTLSDEQREVLRRDITETGLRSDVMHIWDGLNYMELGDFGHLKPVLNYYEYLTKEGNYASANYIMQISNKESIAKYDAVIKEYSADIDRIIKEEDWEAVINFHNRTTVIINGSHANILNSKDWEPKTQREGLINLDALSFEFCGEDVVRAAYNKKLHSLEDKEKWIEKNKDKLEQIKDKIAKAVEDGLIKDSQHGTIWQFKVDKAEEEQEKVLAIKSRLEGHLDKIKDEVVKRLSKFLPNWSSDKAKIIFTMNEKADFCIEHNVITVDLGRLLFEQNPIERVKEGITHEIFHHWMSEKSEWLDSKQDEVSNQVLKNQIVFETVDEGLAVLVSGLSLEKHHIDQGRNFTEYTKESFSSFKQFLTEDNRDKLEKYKDEEFKNMGHFYVVGNEIADAILKNDGMEKFRELIVETRDNPLVFLQRYREICEENAELLKIDS